MVAIVMFAWRAPHAREHDVGHTDVVGVGIFLAHRPRADEAGTHRVRAHARSPLAEAPAYREDGVGAIARCGGSQRMR